MNNHKVKQIVLIDEIIHKFHDLLREINLENPNKDTPELNFYMDIDVIRDEFCKVANTYFTEITQEQVLKLNQEINTYQSIIDKLNGFNFKMDYSCQDYYEALLNQCKIGLEYRKQELNKL